MEEVVLEAIGISQIGNIVGLIAGIVISLSIKELLSSFAFGFLFYLDRNFHEGDVVYVDSEKATIVKISMTRTIFKIHETNLWRYIHNAQTRNIKLEKDVENTFDKK